MESENINNRPNNAEEISIKELLVKIGEWYRYLLSKWLVILFFTLIGSLLGVTYAHFKKPIYTAATTFVLEEGEKGGGLGQYAGLASMVGVDLGGSGGGIFQGDNILELYKSRSMIEKTLLSETDYKGKKELLVNVFIDFNDLREKWDKTPALKNISFDKVSGLDSKPPKFTRLQDSVLGIIVKDINKTYLNVGKPDKKSSIIKVEINGTDEVFAKAFNNLIVENVNDFYVQTKTKRSQDNIAILQQKTDSVRRVMNGEIYTAAAVSDATPNLNPTRQVQRIAPIQRSQFSAETNKLMLGEFVKNLEMSKIALRKETPLIQVLDGPILPLEKVSFSKLKGFVIGGFCAGILACLVLIFRRLLKMILV